ncbi:MAG: (2Fe-2S)-binding protein [Candidatus Aminicenantes bacterium]|nr:(2Fe-2S)-binding protein [Candidatus Aminicenantes bacterium]MDH5466023.1 (2Fe-2S)-binding protein [Candidatus Aminicenantes bacterium]MDH5705577.1 (2Fe-2S)-binding protein [Candidatus Aminicenantes bacterium]
MKTEISFILNGSEVRVAVEGHHRLIDVLRGPLRQTGTKEGCGEGECGSCTVIIDGRAVNSCLYPALEVEGKSVTTIEGLQGPKNELSVLQKSFVEEGAIQCGFCTPGMIMSAKALLDSNPAPSEDDIRNALQGNLCRCTGYVQIIQAVKKAARQLKGRR